MPDDEDLEPRVVALEYQVRDLGGRVTGSEQDAAAARILAGAAEHDVNELRDEVREFRAENRREFADVRSEMRTEFADVRAEMRDEFANVRGEFRAEMRDFRNATTASFNAQRQDFLDLRKDFTDLREHVDRGFMEMRGKFDAAAAGQQQIVDLLHSIIGNSAE